jgi:hypothetical protein
MISPWPGAIRLGMEGTHQRRAHDGPREPTLGHELTVGCNEGGGVSLASQICVENRSIVAKHESGQ